MNDYNERKNITVTEQLRKLLQDMPPFITLYFRGIEPHTSHLTRISYAYDLRIFLDFLSKSYNVSIKDIKIEYMEEVDALLLEEFMEYLKYYRQSTSSKSYANKEYGIMRKLTTIRSLYKYLYKKQLIKANPTVLIDPPKIREREIIRLDPDEIVALLDAVEFGTYITPHQQRYYERTKVRDLAIFTLFLGTGIRVSECVGLDLEDLDFKNSGIRITRKGGSQALIYFGQEVALALKRYYNDRVFMHPKENHEKALFLSLQNKRVHVRTVENLVKKYAHSVTKLKNITPHKLRSTYGTSLYRATGDIYLVADVLGHKDINTTKKHYAAIAEDRRKEAKDFVKLR